MIVYNIKCSLIKLSISVKGQSNLFLNEEALVRLKIIYLNTFVVYLSTKLISSGTLLEC